MLTDMRKQLFKEVLYLLLLILLATDSSLESVQTDDLCFIALWNLQSGDQQCEVNTNFYIELLFGAL